MIIIGIVLHSSRDPDQDLRHRRQSDLEMLENLLELRDNERHKKKRNADGQPNDENGIWEGAVEIIDVDDRNVTFEFVNFTTHLDPGGVNLIIEGEGGYSIYVFNSTTGDWELGMGDMEGIPVSIPFHDNDGNERISSGDRFVFSGKTGVWYELNVYLITSKTWLTSRSFTI